MATGKERIRNKINAKNIAAVIRIIPPLF